MTAIVIDDQRFMSVDGVKIARVTPDGMLEFKDKDRRRAHHRGTQFVRISPENIIEAIATAMGTSIASAKTS